MVVRVLMDNYLQGLTPSGYLRAVDDSSEAYELHPDGNRYGDPIPLYVIITSSATCCFKMLMLWLSNVVSRLLVKSG